MFHDFFFQKKAFNYQNKLQALEFQHKAEVHIYKGEQSAKRLIQLISQLFFCRLQGYLLLKEFDLRRKIIMLLGVVSFSDTETRHFCKEEEFLVDPWKIAENLLTQRNQRISVLIIVQSSLEHPIDSPKRSFFHETTPLPPLATYLLT